MKIDSNEELYFTWWLDELVTAGIVSEYKRGYSEKLSDPVKFLVERQLKTKVKIVEKHVLNAHIYTFDFMVVINPEFAEKCKFNLDNGCLAHIEVKGDYDANNMTRLFRINQKWFYQKTGKVVDLVKIPSFFKKTFTPSRYLVTDKTMKPRKLRYIPRTLQEFMEKKQ